MKKKWEALEWVYDDHGGRFCAQGSLPSWRGFVYEMGDSRYQAEAVEFRLPSEEEDDEDEPSLKIPVGCRDAYVWLLDRDEEVHHAVLKAIDEFFPVLLEQWKEFDDPDLDGISSIADLRDKLNLAYVKLFPQKQFEMPYFGFDFDCAWDSEGFRVLINGTRVVEVQADELSENSVRLDGGAA